MSIAIPVAGAYGSGAFARLLDELAPRPGRLADTLRLVVIVLLTVTIGEVFRMPEIAVSAYVVLFVTRDERHSTVMTATVAGIAVVAAVFATIVLFMASLAEPAIRVPLIAGATFAALFLSRLSPLGPAAFAAGFIMAYGLTVGDQVLGLALQSPEAHNTTSPGLPGLFFLPPEEALLHFLLWLAPVVALPVVLVVAGNLLTGRQPVTLLRAGLAARIAACAAFCAAEPGSAVALSASVRQGSARLARLLHAVRAMPHPPDYASLTLATEQLALSLLAWPLVAPSEAGLLPCADGLREAARRLQPGDGAVASIAPPAPHTEAAGPLAAEIARASASILQALDHPPAAAAHAAGGGLSVPGAWRNPETARFALKVTLCVMLAYGAESLLDWPAIHTCVVTCFFVSLGTIGESAHKALLRAIGALVGGALGIGTILLLMPWMTELGDLLLAIGAVTLVAGWIACGSERLSYAGWQIGLAYYLTVLQGYGPTLDMQTARDRVIGIVLGNAIVLAVFTTLWPVSIEHAVRMQLASAIAQVAALMRSGPAAPGSGSRAGIRTGFLAATNGVRSLLAQSDRWLADPWSHSAGRPASPGTVAALETVMVVVGVVADLRDGAARPYHDHMAAWFEQCAALVKSGAAWASLATVLPPLLPPDETSSAVQAAWDDVLDRQVRAVLARAAALG